MIRDHLYTLVRRHHRRPALFGFRQSARETVQPLFEISAVVRPEFSESVKYFLGDDAAIFGIQPKVRIAERMNIAFCPGHLALRDFKNARLSRCIQITVGSNLDFRIAALLNERRQPADLEFAANQDQDVRLLQLQDETWLRFNEMRILLALGD